MYLPVIISIPILICLWIYFLILLRNSILQSTAVNLNIIDAKNNTAERCKEVNSSGLVKDIGGFKKRKKIHVPKFMLELYEKNKIGGKGVKRPDVVRSVIPTHAGKKLIT